MANIPLRTYMREIEGLVDSGQLEETVAICRHILQIYPKHIDTYRLLGKVFLEGRQLSNAADILQRVLSAIPDDFVSHVGMSIIREDEGNLDLAIWHMERAFESRPANKAIQDELRRLFGRRDGMEPPKIRLTRGALAQMYAKGNLYDQAIAELRGALSEDPQRPDLQLLLAQMNYLTGNKVEAVETSSNILKKFPFCLLANRILALILPQTERADDAKIYQQRAFALDPYLTKAGSDEMTSEDVPDSAITIETLERKTSLPIEGLPEQPAWADTLGIKLDSTEEDELPEWLTEDMGIPSYDGAHVAPFVVEGSNESPIPQDEGSEELIPEWMKDTGWQPTSDESESPLSTQEISEIQEAEEEIEKAEIPDWLREHVSDETLEDATSVDSSSGDAIPPWLDETTPGPTDSIISWLEEKGEARSAFDIESHASSNEGVEIPEWLLDLDGAEEAKEEIPSETTVPDIDHLEIADTQDDSLEELPEWLRELSGQVSPASDIDEVIELDESRTEVVEELEDQFPESAGADDWLQTIETEPTTKSMIGTEDEEILATSSLGMEDTLTPEEIDVPDWLKNLDEEATGEPLFDETLDEPIEIPEWIQELGEPTDHEELSGESIEEIESDLNVVPEEIKTEIQAETEGVEGEFPGEDELPDWLQESDEIKETIPLAPGEIPDETTNLVPDSDIVESESIEIPQKGILDEQGDLIEEEAGLAWLESLAAKQGVSEEELITSPEDRHIETPDWIQEEVIDVVTHDEPQFEEEEIEKPLVEAPESDESVVQMPEIQEQAESMHEDAELVSQMIGDYDIKIDLNKSTLAELERIPGIGFVRAQSIIEHRERHGPFKNIDDLLNVQQIDNASFEFIKDKLTIQIPEEPLVGEEVAMTPIVTENEQLDIAHNALNAGDIDQAVEIFDQFIKESQNLDKIISILEAETSQKLDNILILQTLGDAYMRNDQYQKALEAYTKAEELL